MNDLTKQDIVEALKKQQPQKVKVKYIPCRELIAYGTYRTFNTKKHYCPSCNTYIISTPEMNYCPNCGQRLDFGGE